MLLILSRPSDSIRPAADEPQLLGYSENGHAGMARPASMTLGPQADRTIAMRAKPLRPAQYPRDIFRIRQVTLAAPVHHSAAITDSAIATSTKVSEKVGARPRSAKADGLRAFTVALVRLRLRQYPIGATTTPGMTSLLTFAIASKLPRSLKIRTGLPSPTFRARASFGLTSTNCSPA